MRGETDLGAMLASLTATVRDGEFVVASVAGSVDPAEVEAIVREDEGVTVVASMEVAVSHGWDPAFVGAWITLDVHSALDAVGLTAAVSGALAGAGIPCNMLAGRYHDHLLIPTDRVDDALDALAALRSAEGGIVGSA